MMTRAEYIESLRRLNLKVYFMGELIENPVDHPMIRPSMNSVAKTYELAEKPEYQDLMTVYSPLIGKRITAEACIHHLYFDDADYAALGSEVLTRILQRQS